MGDVGRAELPTARLLAHVSPRWHYATALVTSSQNRPRRSGAMSLNVTVWVVIPDIIVICVELVATEALCNEVIFYWLIVGRNVD